LSIGSLKNNEGKRAYKQGLAIIDKKERPKKRRPWDAITNPGLAGGRVAVFNRNP